MSDFKTPSEILRKIEACRRKKAKFLDLSDYIDKITKQKIILSIIPPEVFTLSHLEEFNLRDNTIQIIPLLL